MTIKVSASLVVRGPSGQFPKGSFTAVLGPARDDLRRDTEQAFTKAADPVNWMPWPARKGAYNWPALNRTGPLRAAAVAAAAGAALNGSNLVVRVKAPKYAGFHMKGTKRIAPRRFVGVSLQTLAAARKRLGEAGVKAMRGKR